MQKNYYFQDDMFRELIIDNFAGGGGASTGIELALGQPVDIAINHDAMAIKMHEKNHPFTRHIQNDVFAVDPLEVTGGRPVGLAWFSPDCTHFSKAKGGKPKKKEIRDLAKIVPKWARVVKPRIIMLENVEEFKTWGPLDDDGYPIKERAGEDFKKWWAELESLGYHLESKELIAADYGAPTIRKRLFIIGRCDGKPIVWPEPTHSKDGKNGLKKWVGANTIIDFGIRGKSIFNRKKELAENTMRRIARGLDKFVIKNPDPFIISYHSETQPGEVRGHSLEEPLPTQGTANRFGLVAPTIMRYFSDKKDFNGGANGKSKPANQPFNTVTTAGAGNLVTPIITQIGQTGKKNKEQKGHFSHEVEEPTRTAVTKQKDLLVNPKLEPFIMVNNTDHNGTNIKEPKSTTTTANKDCLMNPVIVPIGYGEAPGQAPRVQDSKAPVNTIVSHSTKHHAVTYIGREFTDASGSDTKKPVPTITQKDHNRVISCFIAKYYSDNNGQVQGSKADAPLSTITVEERNAKVAVNLIEYYGNAKDGAKASKPLHTVTGNDRHAVITIKLTPDMDLGNWPLIRDMLNKHAGYNLADDEIIVFDIDDIYHFITDIEMRMLEPKELYAAQGFPSDYNYTCDGEMSRSEQVRKVGNSVCPPLPYALVKANVEIQNVPPLQTMAQLNHYITFGSLRNFRRSKEPQI